MYQDRILDSVNTWEYMSRRKPVVFGIFYAVIMICHKNYFYIPRTDSFLHSLIIEHTYKFSASVTNTLRFVGAVIPGVLTLKLLIFNVYFSILVLNSINVAFKNKKEPLFAKTSFCPYTSILCVMWLLFPNNFLTIDFRGIVFS